MTGTNAGSGIDKAFDNELITRNELYAILDQLKDESKFYQLEVFESCRCRFRKCSLTGKLEDMYIQNKVIH